MTEPETPELPESITAWHPMLVALLEMYLPSGWQLVPELLLGRLPQRVDIVILELVGSTPGAVRKLHSIFDYLRPHTLIEHKGPTDDLAGEDALVLLGYGAQYMRLKKLKDPADLCLMVVADRITPGFVEQVTRLHGQLRQVGQGLWQGDLAGATLHGVETKDAPRRGASEGLLYAFSRAFLVDPRGGQPLDEEARRVYALLRNQVEQFRKLRGPKTMKDYELMEKSLEELMRPVLAAMPLHERLAGLTPEQIAGALTPEQIAKVFAALPETALDALPPDVREQIKRRMH